MPMGTTINPSHMVVVVDLSSILPSVVWFGLIWSG